MRLFLRNATFLVALCVMVKISLFLSSRGEVSGITLLGSGLVFGCIAGALSLYFFQRRKVRGVREMSYNQAKAQARQMVAKQKSKELLLT
jgi:hypothetical protein